MTSYSASLYERPLETKEPIIYIDKRERERKKEKIKKRDLNNKIKTNTKINKGYL